MERVDRVGKGKSAHARQQVDRPDDWLTTAIRQALRARVGGREPSLAIWDAIRRRVVASTSPGSPPEAVAARRCRDV